MKLWTATVFALAIVVTAAGCSKADLAGTSWSYSGGGGFSSLSSDIGFTDNHGFVRKYWTVGKHPEPHIGSYSVADGVLKFEYQVRSFGPEPKTAVPFSWDGENLVLNEGTPQTFRPRSSASEASRSLEGMWKRDGEVRSKQTAGVIFLPLNFAVLVGGSGGWDRHSGFDRDWQMCVYSCPEPNVLAEELDATNLGYGIYSRQRSFALQDDVLTIFTAGQPDQVYRRVRGDFPFDANGFNKAVWESLGSKS